MSWITLIIMALVVGHLESQQMRSKKWFEKQREEEKQFNEQLRQRREDNDAKKAAELSKFMMSTQDRLNLLENAARHFGWKLSHMAYSDNSGFGN